MRGTVEAGEGPIRVDQANDKGNTVRSPSRVVAKVGKDELSFLMGRRFSRDGDEYD